jgi:hypothetical protein
MVSPAFLRTSAICWMVSAATTLGLIFLPRLVAPAPDFESQVRLVHDPAYLLRLAIGIVHPLIVLVGALGVLVLRAPYAFGSSTVGFGFFVLWASVESVQQCLTLVALNWTWRAMYLATTDAATRRTLRSHIEAFDAVWDGLFFFLLLAFIVANVLFAVATRGGRGLQRTVSIFFVLGAGLGVTSLLTSFGGGRIAPSVMGALYPAIQPAGRFLTGLWVLRARP